MRKWKWLIGLLTLPLLYVVIVITLRVIGPSTEQRQAFLVMNTPQYEIQRDAFAALWLLPYEVPEQEIEAVAQRDVEAFNVMSPAQQSLFVSSAEGKFPRLPDLKKDTPPACRSFEPGCLAEVRLHAEEAEAWVAKHAQILRKIEALDRYDGLSSGFDFNLRMPFVPVGGTQSLLMVSAALKFHRGGEVQALDRLCRHAATWRRLGSRSDSLFPRMLGVSAFGQSAELSADFLAEMPADIAIPEACLLAFAVPQPQDVNMCATMQGEWQFGYSETASLEFELGIDEDRGPIAWIRDSLTFDADATSHYLAAQYAHYCAPTHPVELLSDRYEAAKTSTPGCSWHEMAHNSVGCILADVAAPAYDAYEYRVLDQAARIRLMGGLLWWRSQAEITETTAARMARMPQEFQSAARPIDLADAGRAMRIRNYDTRHSVYWQVPLPASRIQ